MVGPHSVFLDSGLIGICGELCKVLASPPTPWGNSGLKVRTEAQLESVSYTSACGDLEAI